ncbi:MAG TPA: glycine zipper domain-containing protein [Tepidisphaeraceae bacterium]|nr:glycine zipper domain-containing protein [Tepidisphaeraceae bacterium]
MVRTGVTTVLIAAVGIGCETKAQSGALIGGLSGAAIGGAIGNNNGSAAGGAAIGGVAGLLGGALVGHGMDKHDEKRAKAERYDDYSYSNRGSETVGYPSETSTRISNRDIIDWTNRGVRREIIVDRIERSGQVFNLTAADENQLRDSGVDSSVIRAMRNTSRR